MMLHEIKKPCIQHDMTVQAKNIGVNAKQVIALRETTRRTTPMPFLKKKTYWSRRSKCACKYLIHAQVHKIFTLLKYLFWSLVTTTMLRNIETRSWLLHCWCGVWVITISGGISYSERKPYHTKHEVKNRTKYYS